MSRWKCFFNIIPSLEEATLDLRAQLVTATPGYTLTSWLVVTKYYIFKPWSWPANTMDPT